jgi:hypothetical protein
LLVGAAYSSSEISRVTPQKLIELNCKLQDIGQREKEFPLRLYEHHSKIDQLTTEAAEIYHELLEIMENAIKSDLVVTSDQKNQSLEVLTLLQEQFEAVFELCRDNSIQMSTEFSDYKDVMYSQFTTLAQMERAKLHVELGAWRVNWIQHQVNNTSHQLAVSAQTAHAEREKASMLEKRLSNLTLRTGLLGNEKKASDALVIQAQQRIALLENTLEQMEISQKAAVVELEKRLTNSNSKRHEADVKANLEVEHATEERKKRHVVEDRLHAEMEKVQQLTAANAELKELDEVRSSNQATLQDDFDKLLARHSLALQDLEDKAKHLASTKPMIAELQRKEQVSMLGRQQDRAAHVYERKAAEDRFKEYKESVEVSTL